MRWFSLLILSELFLSFRLLARTPQDQQWLRLVHYRRVAFSRFESSIDTPEFFLDPEGRHDPEAEWHADLRILQTPEINLRGQTIDPQCAFPARTLYFKRLGLLPGPVRDCADFLEFKSRFRIESMSLVFSTAYAGNSASMFGHTLLKLNRSDSASRGGLLDYGVAFLALSDPTDGALYALKGLFGGYSGFYTVQPYYELVNQYAYNENRDLWELPIPLSPEQQDLLVAHLWELSRGASAPYYFTHVNCAAMLAELIDAVKPDWAVRASLSGFVMPTELMRTVARRLPASSALDFRPSQRRRWLAKLEALDGLQRRLYRKAWAERNVTASQSDSEVLDAMLDRVSVEKGQLGREEQEDLRLFEQDILRARSELPAHADEPVRAFNNPIAEHPPRRLGVTGGGQCYGLRLRAGWHDLLDDPMGFEPNYSLNYFDLVAHKDWRDKRLDDLSLTIADVASLNPWKEDDHHLSWTMGGGLRYQALGRSAFFRATGGLSFSMDRFLFSTLPGAELRGNLADERLEVKGLLRLQALARWLPHLRSLAWVEPNIDTLGYKRFDWAFETRFDLSQRYELSVKWDRMEDVAGDSRWELGTALSF